ERIVEVSHDFGFRLRGVGPSPVATLRLFLAQNFLCPGFIGTSNVLDLLGEGSSVRKRTLRRLETPFLLRHRFGQSRKVLGNALPDQIDRVGNGLRLRGLFLRMSKVSRNEGESQPESGRSKHR